MAGDQEVLDVVVVGAGLAGLACAYEVAKSGLQVAVVERGDAPGSKNLSGGRLYLGPLNSVAGDLLSDLPYEREIVSEALIFTDDNSSLTMQSDRTPYDQAPHSVSVLRSQIDPYLAQKVEEAEGFILPQQRVDSLIQEDMRIKGVKIGSDELLADVVVAADGVLSFLAQDLGLQQERTSGSYGLGIKEVISLDSQVIEDRFQLQPGQGAARLFMGQVTQGLPGGGFVYTNKDSLSVGIVIHMESIQKSNLDVEAWQILEKFKKRQDVAPVLAGGSIVEYGAHLIPEGGFKAMPNIGCSGLLLVGDAAGLVVNSGMTLRGMDFALASGILAGKSIVKAKENEAIEKVEENYKQALEKSFVYNEMKTFQKAPEVLKIDRLYTSYAPGLVRWGSGLFEIGDNGRSTTPWQAGKKLFSTFGWQGIKDIWRILRMGR